VAEFSLDTWRTRAAERLRRASRASRGKATRQHKRDLRFILGVAAFIDWSKKQGYTVTFGRTDSGGEIDSDAKTILICSHLSPENQVYNLAHECGHLLIGDRPKDERFGMGYNTDNADERKTLVHRIDVVDEELEAWDRGRKLARRLGIRIDSKRFNKARATYIKTYMKWALKVDGHGKSLESV